MKNIRAKEMGMDFGVRGALQITDAVRGATQVTIHGNLVHYPQASMLDETIEAVHQAIEQIALSRQQGKD